MCEEDKIICFCFNLSYKDIKDIIRDKKISCLEEMSSSTRITLACGACKDNILSIFDDTYYKK